MKWAVNGRRETVREERNRWEFPLGLPYQFEILQGGQRGVRLGQEKSILSKLSLNSHVAALHDVGAKANGYGGSHFINTPILSLHYGSI